LLTFTYNNNQNLKYFLLINVTEGVLLYILKFEMALAARLIASKIILKKNRHLKLLQTHMLAMAWR
jgi:hypothetical protein